MQVRSSVVIAALLFTSVGPAQSEETLPQAFPIVEAFAAGEPFGTHPAGEGTTQGAITKGCSSAPNPTCRRNRKQHRLWARRSSSKVTSCGHALRSDQFDRLASSIGHPTTHFCETAEIF